MRGRRGRDHMLVGFTATYAISAYNFLSIMHTLMEKSEVPGQNHRPDASH
jgi:hypothetical protein